MHPEPTHRLPWHRRQIVRWMLATTALVVLYTIAGFWVVPRIIASQLTQRLPGLTHRQASVGRVEVNPYLLTLTVSNLFLTEPEGIPFASIGRFHADLEVRSLWERAWVLREVEVVRPFLDLERLTNGTFNFANLLPQPAPAPTTNPPLPAFTIQNLRVRDGRIALRDRAIPGGFEKVLTSLALTLTNLNTLGPALTPGHLRIESSTGEQIHWDGGVALNPPASMGAIQIGPVTIPNHGPYLSLVTPASILSGTVRLELGYALSWLGPASDLVISNLALHLEGIGVQLPGANTTNLVLRDLSVTDVSAGLVDRRLRVGRIQIADGVFAAQRGSDGSLDVAQSIRPEFVEEAVRTLHDALSGWSIDLPEFAGERLELVWGDLKPESKIRLSTLIQRINVQGLSNRTNQPVTVTGEARWGETGRARLEAGATLIPAMAQARFEFSNVRLPMLQPYVQEVVNLDVRDGAVDGTWSATYNQNPGGPLISVEGTTEVKSFLAFDTGAGRDFLKWESVLVRDVKATYEPAQVTIGEIHLRAPSTSLVLMTNGQINVFALIRTNPAAMSPSPPSIPSDGTALKLKINLDRLTLTNASIVAADETIPGKFTTTLQRFSGSILDIAWPEYRKSRVDLEGYVGPRAPFTANGWVNPDPARMFLDMHVTATNAGVIPLTPYSIKFGGYPLEDGTITADVTYQVDGRQVAGENHVEIDRLKLGPKSQGVPLIDLPIRLGIALLKDSDGRITLDVPVRGSLDDPEFGVGKVVWQAVKGVFVKVATAPFKLLGSLFGGSEDEGQQLQRIEFAVGDIHLASSATNRMTRLVTALNKRPELLLSVRAGASPTEDGPALARLKLQSALEALQTNLAGSEKVTTPSRKTNEMLFRLFTNTFPALPAPVGATVAEVVEPSAEQMEAQLLKRLEPSEAELSSLGAARLEAVREWLLSGQRLATERLILSDSADTNRPPLLDRIAEFSLE